MSREKWEGDVLFALHFIVFELALTVGCLAGIMAGIVMLGKP